MKIVESESALRRLKTDRLRELRLAKQIEVDETDKSAEAKRYFDQRGTPDGPGN